MGISFEGLDKARPDKRGNYLTDGDYTLEIVSVIDKKSNEGKDLLIVECKVLESSNPEAHAPGIERSWIQNMQDAKVAFRAVKGFLYAVCGVDAHDPAAEAARAGVDAECVEIMKAAVGDAQVLKGKHVRVNVKTITTKTKQQPFALHTFSPAA